MSEVGEILDFPSISLISLVAGVGPLSGKVPLLSCLRTRITFRGLFAEARFIVVNASGLLGKVKEFSSFDNMRMVLGNEGFDDINLRYMGGMWIMIDFKTEDTKAKFQSCLGATSWFSLLIQASKEFVIDERITWVDIEGIPLKLWSESTFNRIAAKWGKMLYLEKLDEGCLYSKRLCILTTGKSNILETFKIIHKGKRFLVRAKETMGWIPDFDEQEEDNSESEDEQSVGFIKEDFDGSDVEKEGDNNVSMVPDSVKEDVNVQAEEKGNDFDVNNSLDPFELYSLLNKKRNVEEKMDKSNETVSIPFPPGFTPCDEKDYYFVAVFDRVLISLQSKMNGSPREYSRRQFTSNEELTQKISHSVFVTNFPDYVNSRDLWEKCSVYGTVVDVFIPSKKSKAGKRFAFVRYDRPHKPSIHKSNVPLVVMVLKKVHVHGDGFLGSKQQMGGAASYVSAVNGATPSCAMGRVKGFDSIPNLQSILSDEGFVNVKISYLGGLWVMFEFDKVDTKMHMMNHSGVNSWFQAIQDVTQDFVSDERVVWIDIGGYSSLCWSRKTFAKIGINGADVMSFVMIIVKGEEGELNGNEDDEVAETIFMDNSSPSMNHSVRMDKQYSADPFGLYDLLDKKTPTKQGGGSVLGVLEEMIRVGRAMGYSMEGCEKDIESIIKTKGDDVMEKVPHMDVKFMWGNSNYDYVFSESVGNSDGILCIWEESIFRKNYVTISDSFVAIYGTWIPNKTKILIVSIYAPQQPSLRRVLWDYLSILLGRWNGEAILIGDYNESSRDIDKTVGSDWVL
ncbi:nucleotide-binding alpha-beta plait domain-containing protein [Tanacetum coccineum]